jgi:hypothetical protein
MSSSRILICTARRVRPCSTSVHVLCASVTHLVGKFLVPRAALDLDLVLQLPVPIVKAIHCEKEAAVVNRKRTSH